MMVTNTIARPQIKQHSGTGISSHTVSGDDSIDHISPVIETTAYQKMQTLAYATAGPTALFAMFIIIFAEVMLNTNLQSVILPRYISTALLLTVACLSFFISYLSRKQHFYATAKSLLLVSAMNVVSAFIIHTPSSASLNQYTVFSTFVMSIATTLSINGVWEESLENSQNEARSLSPAHSRYSERVYPVHIWRGIIAVEFCIALILLYFFPNALQNPAIFQKIQVVPIAFGVGMSVVVFELGRSRPNSESIMHRIGLIGITIQIIFLLVQPITLFWNAAIVLNIVLLLIIGDSLIARQQKIMQSLQDTIKQLAMENTQLREQQQHPEDIIPVQSADHQEWLWIAAHDLKHPISSMIMGAMTFMRVAENQGNAKLAQLGHSIYSSSNRLKRQVDMFLDSVIGLPPQLNLIETDVLSLVTSVIDDERVYDAEQIALSQKPPSTMDGVALDASITVWWDRARMEAVIMNLIKNAEKFSPSPKRIEVYIWQVPQKQEIHFLIQDHGEGMSQETIDHLFQPLYRGPQKGRLIEGHGLGLYMVKTIIEHHQGLIQIESTLGKGTSVHIVLPCDAREIY